MKARIPVENQDVLAALRGFLKRLLETEAVEAVLVPMETPSGAVIPALVADPALLDAADPLAPVLGLNAARAVGPVTVREPRGRIAAVLRPCEYRALVELVKLQQASLEDLVTVVVDCPGTYTVPDYQRMRANGGVDRVSLLSGMRTGDLAPQSGYSFRDACGICENFAAVAGDVRIELFGADPATGIPVVLPDELAGRLGLEAALEDGRRAELVDKVARSRVQARDAIFAEIRGRLEKEGIEGVFAACVRCHNCMTVCPICYCKTCLFKSPVMEHEPMQYMHWARRKGAYRLPADTMLFHLTRLNHMVLSCIGCGLCTDACPAELPVGRVFRAVGQQLQAVFDYVPGRSVEEPLPLITFREDEWSHVGEER
ncbi:MAG: 4Fe-4S dicluster domain-containing protein [Anaerolineae bacterium]|nr:4Fe-4S dicluster domain-containing protein [Anaerolineae bacterium]MCX8067043.1 4Fe-4S dicluster domain-containing protein [Anaerolineae bacterium]